MKDEVKKTTAKPNPLAIDHDDINCEKPGCEDCSVMHCPGKHPQHFSVMGCPVCDPELFDNFEYEDWRLEGI